MNLERIYQLRDSGAITSEEAMRMAQALQTQESAERPVPGVISSWVAPLSAGLAWVSFMSFSSGRRTYALLPDGGTRLVVGGILAAVAVGAWFVCRRTALYHTSVAVRGRVAGGFAVGLAMMSLVIPLLLMVMF